MRPLVVLVAVVLVAATLAAGCLGSDRTFPDESAEVRQLRVNAYAEPDVDPPHDAVVEVEGLDAEGDPHAFRGTLRIVLERQVETDGAPEYAQLRAWEETVRAPAFANQTSPRYVFTIPEDAFPRNGTYRVTVAATVEGRTYEGSALFAHPGAAGAAGDADASLTRPSLSRPIQSR